MKEQYSVPKGTYNGLNYFIFDNRVTITGHATEISGELVIPESIEGCPVTQIGKWAFFNCQNLVQVKMPRVTAIGTFAFAACTALVRVEMSHIKSIDGLLFTRCPKLTDIVITEDNDYYSADGGIIYSKDKTKLIAYPSASGEVELASSVESIGNSAFYGCNFLTQISMPNVTSIDSCAFSYCNALTQINMPNVKKVSGDSFLNSQWYENLTDEFAVFGKGVLVKYNGEDADVTLPDKVKFVSGFYNNYHIRSVNTNKATIIGNKAFSRSIFFSSVEMPKALSIEEEAFHNCKDLSSVSMPKVKDIGNRAFHYCERLPQIDMPNVTRICDSAFEWCKKLEQVSMPLVRSIGNEAFFGCESLTQVDIANATKVGHYAFYECEALKCAYFDSNAPSKFGNDVFSECAPDFCIYYNKSAKRWRTPMWKEYPAKPREMDNK